ncbi:MAG: hypothetical protein R2856_29580 [Caldilineaceae bacterium]
MPTPILATKLYTPPPRADLVTRPRLLTRMDECRRRKLTLVSAPAGFGKTTLVTAWIDNLRFSIENRQSKIVNRIAWLSLDTGENDPIGFLSYLVAALQHIAPDWGAQVMQMIQSPQPPAVQTILTTLVNELAALPDDFILVLDDYHVIEAKDVDDVLAFIVDYMPPQMHLVITTREDPPIPLAKLRARGQLTEIRAADLRFTADEAAGFLRSATGLDFSAEQAAALDARTEGWIAGLQLAALALQGTLSMQGHPHDSTDFIESFTGSHRFVMDYLVEEVLHQQPANVQTFLLRTSILERMCAPLCEAVAGDGVSGEETLNLLERANLFLIPLDNERRWYRYHHLFAELLRQRLTQQADASAYHVRAARWYAAHNLELEAFHHATAAQDIELAIELIEGKGMPLQFRGGAVPVLKWVASLPTDVLDAHPVLWITWGSALLMLGQVVGVEDKAAAAEAALHGAQMTAHNRDLIGRIASLRTTVAVTQHNVDSIIVQAQRALTFLRADNLPVRASINWALGNANWLKGDRAAAARACTDALTACKTTGHTVIAMMATLGLALVQEAENDLHRAYETYRSAVDLVGESATPPICDAYLGMARIHYQWNDLPTARQHAEKALEMARQIETTDRAAHCEIVLARLLAVGGDLDAAVAMLAETEQSVRRQQFALILPHLVTAQVFVLLRQGQVTAAAQIAQRHDLPLCQARVALAQGDVSSALGVLATAKEDVEAKQWADDLLKITVLQALAHRQRRQGRRPAALDEALTLAEGEDFVRLFVDEGPVMQKLVAEAAEQGLHPSFTARLLAAFDSEPPLPIGAASARAAQPSSIPSASASWRSWR